MDARDIDTKVGKDAGRGIGVFVAAGAMALFFVYRARYAAVLNEDAFVPFRYARSPLAGDGLVFNPGGERVEGITNLLWTLALAGASGASGMPLPEISVFLGILCGTLAVCVAFVWCHAELRDAPISRSLAVPAARSSCSAAKTRAETPPPDQSDTKLGRRAAHSRIGASSQRRGVPRIHARRASRRQRQPWNASGLRRDTAA